MGALSHTHENLVARSDLAAEYQRHWLELRRFFALRSWDPDAVDDLLQTMYVRIRNVSDATAAPAQDEVRDPRQYLFRAAWNLLHSEHRRLRAERLRAVSIQDTEWDECSDRWSRFSIEDDTSSSVQLAELERALAELPPASQFALLRQYRDNRTYKEIADEMGVTTHAVKKYITRALTHFRTCLNTTPLDPSSRGMRGTAEGKRR